MLVCISILDVEEAMELTKSAFFCSAYTKNKYLREKNEEKD